MEKQENKMIEKYKGNGNKKRLIIYVSFLLILIYLIYGVYLLVMQPTDKVTVEKGTLYLEETNIGYIIREEKVVKGNNYKNGMEQIKNEGEKTAKEDSIYRYYSKNEDTLKVQIAELDNKIQEVLKSQTELFPLDIKLLEDKLDEQIEGLSIINDMAKISEYKKQINDIIAKKSKMVGEKSTAGSYLKQLYNQRTKFEEQLNSGAEYIKAPVSGVVSYKVDGLEEILTPNNFSTINKEFLDSLKLKTGQLIATNTECGKVIDVSKCYIATISNSEEAKNAQIDDNVKIRLSNNKVIDAKVNYISQENDNEILIILEIDKQISDLANYRKISFELIWWSSTGLKVPNQAIIEDNGLNYVVRNRAGYLNKILVKVTRKNDKYSIVSTYSTEELKEIGFTDKEINSMKRIAIYDELFLNPDLSKIE